MMATMLESPLVQVRYEMDTLDVALRDLGKNFARGKFKCPTEG